MARPGEYHQRGPPPWVPAIILAFVLLVAIAYKEAPKPTMQCRSVSYHPPKEKPAPFLPSLMWVPIAILLWFQFFAGNSRSPVYGRLGASERRIGASYGPGGPLVYCNIHHARNRNNQPGTMSILLDYGAHWLLLLLGIWLYTSFGGESSPEPATTVYRQCSTIVRR